LRRYRESQYGSEREQEDADPDTWHLSLLISSKTAAKNAEPARADRRGHDEQDDAQENLTLEELYDADDRHDDCDKPKHAAHAHLLVSSQDLR
jgi:hypothetical protein